MKQTTNLQIIHSALNFRLIIHLFTLILDCYNIHEAFFCWLAHKMQYVIFKTFDNIFESSKNIHHFRK